MACQGEGNYNVQVTFDSLYILYIEHVECTWPVREKEIIMYMSHFLCSRTCGMTRGLSGRREL